MDCVHNLDIESSYVAIKQRKMLMSHLKMNCIYCPPPHHHETSPSEGCQDWEMHPSWITGMESLNAYSNWVSSVVLPIAFQWIDEHRSEVYATVPEELKDDVGVVIAAAFKLVKELPAYKNGMENREAYEAGLADGTCDSSKINPVWTSIVKKVRTGTEEAFAEQASLLGNPTE
jgi:hypothetical protein